MATIEKRPLKDKRTIRYRVKWRIAGTPETDSETFDNVTEAKRWKGLVEAFGHQRPGPEDLVKHGFAHLAPASVGSVPALVAVAEPMEDSAGQVTLECYARDYVDRLVKPSRETRRKYLERLEMHLFRTLGQRPLVSITRRMMREWQQGLMAAGLSAKTIANVRGEVLFPMFEASCLPGEDDEPPVRAYNPLRGLPLPDRIEIEREIIESDAEAMLFIEAAYEVDPNAAELLVTKLATGMRWGEIAGLPVRSFHEERMTVSIQQVVVREYHTWFVRPKPKTKDGYRELPVPDQILEILRRRCADRDGATFVFTAPEGNFWRYSQFYDGRWEKIRDLAQAKGLRKRMTLHALRHSLLTLLATEGINLAALRDMAGHKRISTTFDLYVHASRKHHPAVRAMVEPFAAVPLAHRAG